MSSEVLINSTDKGDAAKICSDDIKETTCTDKLPGDNPSSEEQILKVQQESRTPPKGGIPRHDITTPAATHFRRQRSQSEDGSYFYAQRNWQSDKTANPSRLRSRLSRPMNMRDSTSTRVHVWLIIGQIISAVALFFMTIAAALAIHWLIGPSDIVTPTAPVVHMPIETGDACGSELLTVDFIEPLGVALRKEVFGQELAVDTLVQTLSEHFSWNRSGAEQFKSDPIIVVLHGGTGTGKTHTAWIMSRHLSLAGTKVHWYFPILQRRKSRDIARGTESNALLDWVVAVSSPCSSAQVFILDDVDANDHLSSQLDAVVSYWKSMTFAADAVGPIFVITSSKDSEFLGTLLLDHLAKGNSRESFSRDVAEWRCPFGRNVLATYIPFLPIQKEHLKECIRHARRTMTTMRGASANDSALFPMQKEVDEIEAVVNRTHFVPVTCALFAKYGCKQLQLV